MNREAIIESIDHDASLVTEFLRLTPAERLAELESMIEFVEAARRAMDEQVYRDPSEPGTPRG
jgi:hypothetical protein